MEVSYRMVSLYLCCVFFSFEAHRKLVNGANLELFIHFPYSSCQYCNRQFHINILSFQLIVLIWIPLVAFPRRRSERMIGYGWMRSGFPSRFPAFLGGGALKGETDA